MIPSSLPVDMLEAPWQAVVLRIAALYGWLAYHTYDSRRSERGFPDLVLIHPKRRRILYIELKTNRGRTTVHQRSFLRCLRSAGAEVAVLRPRDLPCLVEALGPKNHSIKQSDQEFK